MQVEIWTSAPTRTFADDMAHEALLPHEVRPWIAAIEKNPLVGLRVADEPGLAVRDHAVRGYVIRYLVVPERRHICLLTLRRAEEDTTDVAGRARLAWRRLVELAGILRLFGP